MEESVDFRIGTARIVHVHQMPWIALLSCCSGITC